MANTRRQEAERIAKVFELVEASNLKPNIKRHALLILMHGPSRRQVTTIRTLAERAGKRED